MPAVITSISPPRGRVGDEITVNGTGFAAANNAVELVAPDGTTTYAQSITSQGATQVVFTLAGALTSKGLQYLVRVTNQDDTTEDARAWLLLEDLATLETYRLSAQAPGPAENRATENPTIAEAKDWERLAMVAEFARDKALAGGSSELLGAEPQQHTVGNSRTINVPAGELANDGDALLVRACFSVDVGGGSPSFSVDAFGLTLGAGMNSIYSSTTHRVVVQALVTRRGGALAHHFGVSFDNSFSPEQLQINEGTGTPDFSLAHTVNAVVSGTNPNNGRVESLYVWKVSAA